MCLREVLNPTRWRNTRRCWPRGWLPTLRLGTLWCLGECHREYSLNPASSSSSRMYSVPASGAQQERETPHSVKRNVTVAVPPVGAGHQSFPGKVTTEVFLWGQAVYILGELLTKVRAYPGRITVIILRDCCTLGS